jgi:hypothetical protein
MKKENKLNRIELLDTTQPMMDLKNKQTRAFNSYNTPENNSRT